MRDRRPVDELSIEELEQILRIRKREARLARLQRLERVGRRRSDVPLSDTTDMSVLDAGSERPVIPHESFIEAERRARRTRRDQLLLAIEAVAAMGLVAVLVYTVWTLRDLNRASAEQQAEAVAALPDATPTALITAVVLPGGHTPPTDPGGAQPNYNEVPAHLRPLVEQQIAGPALMPTTGPTGAVRLRIPAIGVDAPVVQGDGWEQLKKGVGQHIGSADPGQNGNLVLSAHNDIYGEIFRNLDRLQVGDQIIVSTQLEDFVYEVVDTRIVAPTQVEVMEQTREPIVTLISCYPYMVNSDRIVVIAELVE